MKLTSKTFYNFFDYCIKILAGALLLFLSVIAIIYRNSISFDILETSTITPNTGKFYFLLLLSFFILYVTFLLLKWIPENGLFIVLSILYLIAGTYLITHIEMILRYDSGICFWNAQNFVNGNFSNLQFGEYFYKNPHQLGLVSYNCLLLLFSENPNFVYYVNLLWILATNFFLWQTLKLLYPQNPLLRKITILLSFAFLPQFFYLFYAYGQVPGLGCLMIAAYLTTKAILQKNKLSFVLSLFFIGFACAVRMNYVIGGIALIIIYLMHTLKKQKITVLVAVFGILCSMFIPKLLINSFYEHAANTDLSNGMPSTLYIAMGLQEAPAPWRAAGWYNSFNDNTYLNNNCDVAIANSIALESIHDRLHAFVDNPTYAIDFFGEKLITTWCEPTFQSIWSGPLISMNCTTNELWLQELYSGGMTFQILAALLNVLSAVIFVFSFVCILWKSFIRKEELNTLELFSLLFFIGGFIFHLFWETKSQYVYPYMVFLIPVAANGLYILFTAYNSKNIKIFNQENPYANRNFRCRTWWLRFWSNLSGETRKRR